ncbi:endolysin [Microbacterium phage DizzyRudy]|nr:endolysin [Microbacterium phage DizzyRudy]
MGGTPEFVFRNGSRLTPYMFYQIERLNFDLKRLFGVEVIVTSGIRLHQEQIDIFLKRYVTAGNINGRHVYDTRVWNGVRYYRISREGTVAVPGFSNHEIQGNRGAVDLRDTGSDAGITNKNSVRGRWFRANCRNYDMVMTGDSFGEGWHSDMLNIFAAVPGGNPTPIPVPVPKPEEEEDDMPKNSGVWYKKDKSTYVYLVFNTGSGFAHEFSNGTNAGTMPGTYTAGLKASMDIAGWSEVTLGHANVIKSALAAVRPKDAPKEIELTIVNAAELAALDN